MNSSQMHFDFSAEIGPLESSLSVLFPVHNAQAHLDAEVTRLLEILPELTPRFELLIIDDGSHDATPEVAQELTSRFPQIRVLRHAQRLGLSEAIRNGLNRTSGEMILIHDGQGGLAPDELPRVWRQRQAGIEPITRRDSASRTAPAARRGGASGVGSGSKSWFSRWLPAQRGETLRPAARRSGFHLLQRIALRQMQHVSNEVGFAASATSLAATLSAAGMRADELHRTPGAERPNFLQKVRDFAVGE